MSSHSADEREPSGDERDHCGDEREGEGSQEKRRTRETPAPAPEAAAGDVPESLLTTFMEISGLDPMTASHYLQVTITLLSSPLLSRSSPDLSCVGSGRGS